MSEESLAAIESKLDAHTETLDAHTKTLDKLEVTVEGMRDEIKQIAEGHAATEALITRNFVAMHALIESKVDPFVKSVQHHSAILAAHKLSLPWEDRDA